VRAGARGREVDAAARNLIAARGYGDNFGHGLGHGIGRVCHDHLALSPLSELTLEEGMVLTVEPGIYIEAWGGVRIEDDVVVTAEGCEVLTHARKELIEVPL
jgi:Xaa-Pro aminopeptidase